MNSTIINVTDISPVTRDTDAAELGATVYERLSRLLAALPDAAWDVTTECDPWTVADMVRHMVGAAKGHISLRETIRQTRYGSKHAEDYGGSDLDAMNDLQIRDHADLGPAELRAAIDALGAKAVTKRMKQPWFIRRINVPNAPGGNMPDGSPESIRLGHLFDAILTRDVWLHRLDIARAVGTELTADDVDRRIIEDVVGDWAERHGQPFELRLTGPAGGPYVAGSDGERLEMDAIEFARVLSGRTPSTSSLTDVKVLF